MHAAADADRAARPDRYDLGDGAAERVVRRAVRNGDVADLGPASGWRDGLDAYLASAAADGRLNAVGRRMVLDTAAAKLRARTAIDAARRSNGGGRRLAAPPIVIIGGWRTGTTFLFRLLATEPRLRAPLPAELTAPWRFAGLGGDDRERLIDAGAAAHDLLHLLNPALAAVHDSGARLPEECVLAMGTDLRNWGFSSTVRLDGYTEWLARQDLAGSYERHRDVLELLEDGSGRRWVLKAPAHTAELPNLAAAHPGAVVVHLHRDVVETIASGSSLFATFRATYSDEVDPVDVGRFQTDQTERWLRRAADFRRSPAAAGVTYLDVAYADLVADPGAVVQQVLSAAGMAPAADVDGLVAAHAAAQPRHGKGAHRYSPEAFGLDPGALRERFAALVPCDPEPDVEGRG